MVLFLVAWCSAGFAVWLIEIFYVRQSPLYDGPRTFTWGFLLILLLIFWPIVAVARWASPRG